MQNSDPKLEEQNDVSLKRQKRLLSFLMSKKIPPVPSDEERKPFGEYHTNLISRAMFWWLNPILQVGYKRTLTENDLFYLEDKQKTDNMYSLFRSYFEKDMKKAIDKFLTEKFKKEGRVYNSNDEIDPNDLADFVIPTLLIPLCLFKTLKFEYSMGIIYKILSDSTTSTAPLLQKKLITFVQYKALGLDNNVGKGVGYAIGVCLMIFFSSLTISHAFHHLQICGAKSRAILTRLLLDKTLSIDDKGNHSFAASKVQSVISTDINRIDLAIGFLPFLLTTFIPVAICIGLLIWNIGVSALVGIGIFIVVVIFLGSRIRKLMGIRQKASVFTDLRVNLMKELLKNYKMIKFYSWEKSYGERIQNARITEMNYVLKLQSTRNVLMSLAFAMPIIASMATFCTAFDIASGKTAANIFSSLSLFQVLSIQFMLAPMALTFTADMIVSFKKINKFLVCNDIDEKHFSIEKFTDEKLSIKVENGDFEWDQFDDDLNPESNPSSNNDYPSSNTTEVESSEKFSSSLSDAKSHDLKKTAFPGLHDINIDINKGEFVVVTGSIGSGKSSLLNAIAGLMKRTNGKILVDGDLLLCGYPWVKNSSIRDNILFGLPYDEDKYRKVVDACSLKSDFDQFPGGDMIEVGERGITLSGGQKARINLARAVYADKDILLLDDVLSAVDAKVGKHIVENCILGLLKDKTRIMATHQLSLIESADKMIFINGDGTIDMGTIDELKERNQKLINLLTYQNNLLEKNPEESIETEEEKDIALKEQEFNLHLLKTVTEPTKSGSGDNIVKIVGDEERAVNSLKFSIYLNYCKLAFGKFKFISPMIFVSFAILTTFCNIFTNTWLTFWIEDKFTGRPTAFYMGLYVMFSFLYTIFLATFFYLICYFTNNAARFLNLNASKKILHVPMAFMDVSPIGRVLNRFTKDTDTLDNELVEQLRQFINPFCNVVGTIILCIIYIPWFAIAVPLIIIFYVVVANYYQASAREIKRLEAVKRSLVYSHFNEVLSGKDTIKAYNIQQEVKDRLDKLIDSQNEAYFLTLVNQRWLGANLSILSFFIVFIISMLCVFTVFSVNAATTGLLLTYVMNITGILTMMMRALTQVENEFNSVERLNYYAFDVIQEAPYEIPENDPAETWPQNGEIIFKDVSMKYRPELPYVLKNINMHINKNEKVGFCGRTGAGKSTFMTCLYRFTEFEGNVIIDDVDISKLGLHKLRSKLTIIPQDPVLFIGTIRENLDPFKEHSDEKLWDALSIAGLVKKEDLESVKLQENDDENLHKFHLNRTVEDDGTNFSIGERQLIALARALVRKTKILILDEATSSVDYETDSKIQKTIASEFKDCTILCIAHRLNTILNYDRILVMDQGQIVEFDSPKKLFMNKNGVFRTMCDQAKITIEDF
jgi:ABC-type multidrug transport system fused ATPase/permease subunit